MTYGHSLATPLVNAGGKGGYEYFINPEIAIETTTRKEKSR